MTHAKETRNDKGVDTTLVAAFLKMSPEERLRTNDNAVRAILELRDAYRQQTARQLTAKPETGSDHSQPE